MKNQQSYIPISVGHLRDTSRDMTAAFYTRPYGSSIEIRSNLRRQEIHRQKQGSKFLKSSFSNRDN